MNRFGLALITCIVFAMGIGVVQILDRPVQTLRIKSDLTVGERAQVEALLRVKQLGGILSFDMGSLRNTLAEMPWAREIYIKRRWPDIVEITLQRERPIARWGDAEFITASSDIVALPDDYPELPRLDAALSSPADTLRVYRLVDQLVKPSDLRLTALRQSAHGEWQIIFAKGFTVQLGVDRLPERVNRFLNVYNNALLHEARSVAYIDVRYASGAAVKFADRLGDHLIASRP